MTRSLPERLVVWRNFEECLVYDVRPTVFGYGLDLVMNYVWSDGRVREDILDAPQLVTLRMLGVDQIIFAGGLTQAVKDDPEAINWGLTEVVRVVSIAAPPAQPGVRCCPYSHVLRCRRQCTGAGAQCRRRHDLACDRQLERFGGTCG